MELKTGHLLAGGRYRIERVLGQGGFGITYEAHDTRFKSRAKSVAIKEFFVKDFCNRENETNRMVVATQGKVELVERLRNKFIDEANALFELEHTNIVRVTDIFEENGTAYYVMEYVNGSSLSSIVEKNGRLGESEALGYIRQVADALRYVHSQNRLHLDVKPQNIMIDGNGKAVLIDFGVSKQYDEVKGENTSTLLGCTPGYAPIEQIGGEIVEFHAATDVYSLGATLYKLITGITPASANKRASSMKLKELAFPDDITPATRAAIDAAMRLYVENRPQSIGEFLALLECHSEQSEESPKNANKEILPPSGRQNDNSGKVKDESGKRDGVEDCPPALRGTSAAEGVNDSPSTDDGETVVGNSANPVILSASEESPKHANKEILPPSGRQNDKGGEWKDESGKMRDESGELRGERKESGGSSKKRWAIIIAVLVIGAVAALLGTMSGGGSDDTAAERERLAAERKAAEQKRKEEERKRQEAASNSLSTRTFTVNGVSFKMVAVDGGTFTMGATSEQQNPYDDEKPVHNVTLSDYFIGETEVTQALWEAVMGTSIYDQAKKGTYGTDLYGVGNNNPMYYISYDDCITFINKLNSQLSGQLPSGRKFRLPTEAEWEFAARGGNRSRGNQYSGSNSLGSVAWYWDNSNSQTHPVKQKQANELGLYDMSGNVYEWCYDWYGNYSSSSQTNPKGPSSGSCRVLRGGSWSGSARLCRVADRYGYSPGYRDGDYGLRLAL